ncbi:hypothetical protein SAMN05444673_3396 [Bacillus sp. OV166]|uniref:hypothetical protein n=1 Tax=Bacillus sp. OV166 TaxID=1882763 RepID=UPI000A2AC26F|nr:hypothetical protein [Bacillus sp. OV166]SMQ78376.1 hypothetical protein SAMN05444673_3396 [Bacillus sp. OV166]
MLIQDNLHIQISKKILNLEANEAYFYSILSKSSLLDGGAMVHLPQLAEMLGVSNRTENRDKIKQSLANLESNLGFEYYTDFQLKKRLNLLELKGTQYFYAKVPSVIDNFLKMSLGDFNKLVYFEEKECKQMIMFQYLYIVGMVNESGKERKISYPTVEGIAAATGFDRKTVFRYNEILVKYNLIYMDTVTIKDKSHNKYSRWSDKEDVIEAVAEVKITGYISKKRKTQHEGVVETTNKVVAKSTTPKNDNTGLDPSIDKALVGFVKAGLAMHKGTKSKINEAIEICGVEQLIIGIKELDFICRNNGIPESKWAGYFSNNIISKAKERKKQVEAQKRANEKLMNEPVTPTIDYTKTYRETQIRLKEMEKEKKIEEEEKLMKSLSLFTDEQEKPKEDWLLALGI